MSSSDNPTPRLIRITKQPPKVIKIRLARPTVTIETAWEQVQW